MRWDACALLAMQVPGRGHGIALPPWASHSMLWDPLPQFHLGAGPWGCSQDLSPAVGKPGHLQPRCRAPRGAAVPCTMGLSPCTWALPGIACALPCRQHKLEENLLFSGKFTDALQALMDWLYRAEPQLSEDVPVGGDRDLVSDLMDKHKVGVPSHTRRSLPCLGPWGVPGSAPALPTLHPRAGQQPWVQDGALPTRAAPALPEPVLPVLGAVLGCPMYPTVERGLGCMGALHSNGGQAGCWDPPASPTPSCPLLPRSSRRSWASEPAASRC